MLSTMMLSVVQGFFPKKHAVAEYNKATHADAVPLVWDA